MHPRISHAFSGKSANNSYAMLKAKPISTRCRVRGLLLPVCLAGLCLLAASLAAVCAAASPQEAEVAPRILTSEEGRAIVNAAWEHEQQVRGKPDCSHLVHEIYSFAGFGYPYASSFDLYAGSDNFARVRTPQPGDLIVWPGHVGIVLDPAQHSFYSSVRSGLRTDYYNAPYWRRHRPARFYRYVTGSPGSVALAGARSAPRTSETSVQIITVPVIEEHAEAPSTTPKQPAKAALGPAAAVVPVISGAGRATFEIPPSIPVVAGPGKPTPDEIAEAVSELSNAAGNILRTDDLSKLRLPVVVFDQLQVESAKIKGDRGWALFRVDSRVSIDGERIVLKRRREKIRWELRRTESGWVAFTPLERAYVPRDVAVRILAGQLARLANNDSGTTKAATIIRQEAQLASLLNDLLKNR